MSVRSVRQIFLNSKDKDENYSSNTNFNSNMRFYLNQPIHIPPNYNLSVALINFQCPISWGNINSYNNTLTINGNTQTVDTGNYNITELIDELNTKFTGIASFTNDSNTNKTTITITSSQNPNTLEGSMLEVLGFYFYTPTNNSVIESDGICDLAGFRYLVLRTNFHTKNVSSFSKRPMNILAHIPINNDDYLSYVQTDNKFLVNNKDVNFIDIMLQTPDHKDINLRGVHFSLTLELDFIKKEEEN